MYYKVIDSFSGTGPPGADIFSNEIRIGTVRITNGNYVFVPSTQIQHLTFDHLGFIREVIISVETGNI